MDTAIIPVSLFTKWWVTESTAASGGYSEPEEGKVTSNQEGIYAVAECDDNFSGLEVSAKADGGRDLSPANDCSVILNGCNP